MEGFGIGGAWEATEDQVKTAYKGELAPALQGPKATSFLQGHRPYLPLAPAACWSAQASLQHLHSFLKQSARPGAGGGLWGGELAHGTLLLLILDPKS